MNTHFNPSLLNPREAIGSNNPPTPIDYAQDTTKALSDFLLDHPVIQTEAEARDAKLHLDRAKGNLDDMERERDKLVRPLNEEVATINGRYRTPRTALENLVTVLRRLLTGYAKEVERERLKAAQEAAERAAEAERIAREAEAREKEALEDISQGVCADIGAATIEADVAFAEFERRTREADRAERDTKVRLGGGFNRSVGLREHTTLIVSDWRAAVAELSAPDDVLPDVIRDAVLTAARGLKKATGSLPAGITVETERRV